MGPRDSPAAPTAPLRAADWDSIPDDELVVRAQSGDPRAEEALFRRCAPAVGRTVERLLGSTSDADDLVQDTFLAAFDELADLRDPRAFRGWILQIAVRKAHRRFRRRKLMRALGLDRSEPPEVLGRLAAPGLDPDARAQLALLDARLAHVPLAQRTAWLLRRVEGRPLAEVAQACGCSLATAKRWITRAEATLGLDADTGGTDE